MYLELASHAVSSVGSFSAFDPTTIIGLAEGDIPQVSWVPGAELQNFCRKAAFILMLIWVVWIAAQFAVPSKRQGANRIGWGKFMVAGAICIILMDLTLLPTVINALLKGGYYLYNLVTQIK